MPTDKTFPIQGEHGRRDHTGRVMHFPATRVDQRLAELAYAEYVNHGGRGQSLERLGERGGFGLEEFAVFLLGALGYDVRPFGRNPILPPKKSRPPWPRDLNPDVFKGDDHG